MIDSRYGLKYSFPHTLVHIVDNSMYTGQSGVTETYDPSLLSTLVVTGMPMGVDNRITTVTRSDVLNKAFGAEALTVKDIETYGQSVEYPSSLINQGVPVKLLRVTPPGATYAISILYYDWRRNGKSIEARLRCADEEDLITSGINLASYKNTERLAKAIFTRLKKDSLDSEYVSDENWHRVVLMAYISAGKGSAYNNFSVYINEPTIAQRKKFANAIYNFGTIDDRYATPVEIERFTASLINDATKLATYGIVSTMDTVNIQMKKRLEGSSIMIPYLNEEAVRKIYETWYKLFNDNLQTGGTELSQEETVYRNIFNDIDVNKFDIIYGKYLYTRDGSDTEVPLPYYTVDMEDSEIQKLNVSNIIAVDNFSAIRYESPDKYDFRHSEKTSDAMSAAEAANNTSTSSQDDVMAAIFKNKIYPHWNHIYGKNQKRTNGEMVWKKELLNTMWSTVGSRTFTYTGASATEDRRMDYEKIRYNTAVAPGTLYLSNPDTEHPSISMIYSIGQYTGLTMSVNIPELYHFYTNGDKKAFDKEKVGKIKKVISYGMNIRGDKLLEQQVKDQIDKTIVNKNTYSGDGTAVGQAGKKQSYGSIIAVTYFETTSNTTKFKLYRITELETNEVTNITKVKSIAEYPGNYYAAMNWESWYNKEEIHDYIALKSKVNAAIDAATPINTANNDGGTTPKYPNAYSKLGALFIDDTLDTLDTDMENWSPIMVEEDDTNNVTKLKLTFNKAVRVIAFFNTDPYGDAKNPIQTSNRYPNDIYPEFYDVSAVNPYRVGNVPTSISITEDFTNREFDYIYMGADVVAAGYGRRQDDETGTIYPSASDHPNLDIEYTDAALVNLIRNIASKDPFIYRYQVTSFPMNTIKIVNTNTAVPNNYYINEYGICPNSEHGGMVVIGGSSGFFDDYINGDITTIEFKLRYSELLTQAFRGEIDSRILSPARVPAKYLFDAGYNTVMGIKSLPFHAPDMEDIIFASTIFTTEEKEEYAIDSKMVSNGVIVSDIDVKQAMYDLMIHRCYQGIPEDKRPIGPGSGLSLHLDSGFCDIEVIKKLNQSFKSRFTNPNASWDIGGYTSAVNGVTYTYVKRLVDHMFDHMQRYTVNKPFVNTYTEITPDEYLSFFPDIDTTDWDLEELMYTSGGNSWVLDESRSLKRKSQRTLYHEETGTSDLLQENNMRTLSQLVYLLQNRIDRWLLEYVDDGVLTSMTESINNIFSGWVGTRVQALDIRFEQDVNIDGSEIVICYVNVTFRGLLLRVPIIVNVNRREI